MINFFYRFIPKLITNRFLIWLFEVMRRIQKGKSLQSTQYIDSPHIRGYVENQKVYKDLPYGKATMAYSGCEIFAAYNILLNWLGHDRENEVPSIVQMIQEFEKDGMVRGGMFGTAPKAIRDYLERKGLTTTFSFHNEEFDEIAEKAKSIVFTMYNDYHNLGQQIHTIAITKDLDGYTAHNVYCNGTVVGPFPSFNELVSNINEGKVKGICIIGVNF